jgi:hypothetical protein
MKCFVAILITALYFGNPTKNQHRKKITNTFCEITSVKCNDILDNASYVASQNNLEYTSYYLFSTCKAKDITVSYGLLGFVKIRNRHLISLVSIFKI